MQVTEHFGNRIPFTEFEMALRPEIIAKKMFQRLIKLLNKVPEPKKEATDDYDDSDVSVVQESHFNWNGDQFYGVTPSYERKLVRKNIIPKLKERFLYGVQIFYDSIDAEILKKLLRHQNKVSIAFFENFLDLEVEDSAFKNLLMGLEVPDFSPDTQELIYYIKMRLNPNLMPESGMSDETLSLIWANHLVRKDNYENVEQLVENW
jgi:hypothetical protein